MQATIPAGLDRKEAEVYRQLDPERLPKHIAIIMDGNGRWARRRHLPRMAGHRAGVASVRSTVETAARIGIPWLTLYAFSEENWKKRPRSEVDFLMGLLFSLTLVALYGMGIALALFQTAVSVGKSPLPSISIGPALSKSRPQCAMSQWWPIQSSNCPPPIL